MQLLDIRCPKCKSTCWVNNGDESDLTAVDVEGVICWKCKAEFDIDGDLREDLYLSESYSSASKAAEDKTFPIEVVKAASRMRKRTSKDCLEKDGSWKIEFIEDLAIIADVWLEENPEVGVAD
jgi:hypothetical protein